MPHALSKLWWVPALRGVCAIAIGIGAFVVPAATLAALILVFGAYALVEGLLLLITVLGWGIAPMGAARRIRRWARSGSARAFA